MAKRDDPKMPEVAPQATASAVAPNNKVSGPPPFLFDGPAGGPLLALAHGAGAPMDSPFMAAMAAGLAAQGLRVARFEFPYMRVRREAGNRPPPDPEARLRRSWQAAIAALGGGRRLCIGGKSLGGRIASLIADESGVAGLVCLGYPFLPPGSTRPPRTAHLRELRTPALILQGTRDPFGGREAVAAYPLAASIRIHWLEDGDHSWKPRKASGRSEAQNLAEAAAVAADFVRGALAGSGETGT